MLCCYAYRHDLQFAGHDGDDVKVAHMGYKLGSQCTLGKVHHMGHKEGFQRTLSSSDHLPSDNFLADVNCFMWQ